MIREEAFQMHRPHIEAGFTPPAGRRLGRQRRSIIVAELVATIGLMLGTIVAATVVGAGIARADASAAAAHDTSLWALAFVMAAMFAGMGGLTAISLTVRTRKPPRRD
jgi:hypothetical protein